MNISHHFDIVKRYFRVMHDTGGGKFSTPGVLRFILSGSR